MKKILTPTLALIIAGGLVAGIALARPATSDEPDLAQPAATTTAAPGFLNAPPAGEQTGDTATITIVDFGFDSPITVAPGQTVTVVNGDGTSHTATADGGAFDTGTIAGGGTTTITAPTQPGTYSFFCAIHPSMRGELVVQG